MNRTNSDITVVKFASFTLLELLVVLVIIGVALALIGPRISLMPKRVAVRKTIGEVHTAFSEAAMRARTTGRPVTLFLLPEKNRITLRDGIFDQDDLVWESNRQDGNSPISFSFADNTNLKYDLDKQIEWRDIDHAFKIPEGYYFFFFPDGDSAGPTLEFVFRDLVFGLKVARLTGRLEIFEIKP